MDIMWRALKKKGFSLLTQQQRNLYQEIDRYKGITNTSFAQQHYPSVGITKSTSSLQFSKSPLTNQGCLPQMEIPEPLKYVRPCEHTVLNNGIRVYTENWPAQIASIGVIIGAGSRHEDLQTSGTAHFMEHLHFKVIKY